MSVSTRAVFVAAGFEQDWSADWTEQLPTYLMRVGPFEVRASELTSMTSFRPVFVVSPIGSDGRRIFWDARTEMPLVLDSIDQGFAWLADLFQRWDIHLHPVPGWFDHGVRLSYLLPWVEQRARYDARPQCTVDREWLRVAVRKLRAASATAELDAIVQLSFDGAILRFTLHNNDVLAMPAKGSAWPTLLDILLTDCCRSFGRIMHPVVHFGVWDGYLVAGGRRVPLLDGVEPNETNR